jgi:CBS-domain-containing membrane protein
MEMPFIFCEVGTEVLYTILKNSAFQTAKFNYLLPGLSPRTNYTDRADRRLSMKLLPTFANRGCHVVSVTDSYGRIVGFLDRSRYFFYQAAPQLYSRG